MDADWIRTTPLLGGILIGLSATLLLAGNGRIAGISGAIQGALRLTRAESWRWVFLGSMVLGGALYEYVLAPRPTPTSPLAPVAMVAGGFLVGYGTRLGNGCTSGHGVCGLGRRSARSLVAVWVFMTAAIVTVALYRHLLPSL